MTLVLAILARLSPAWRLLLAALRSPLGQVAAAALIFGSLAWWHGEVRYGEGVKAERGRWESALVASAAKARATEARNANASQAVGKAVAVETVKIQWRTKTLIERIPYDVPPDPAGWSLPVGFVRHHVESTAGLPPTPDAASRAADEPSGVGLAELAEVDDANAGTLALCRVQVKGWQDWWAAVSAPSNPSTR